MSMLRRFVVVINAIDIQVDVPEHVRPPCCGAIAGVAATAQRIVDAQRRIRRGQAGRVRQ